MTRALAGEISLLSQREMELVQNADYEERLASGMPPKTAHHLLHKQWKYYDDLTELGVFKSVSLLVEKLFNYVISERMKDTTTYKNINFTILGEYTFIATPLLVLVHNPILPILLCTCIIWVLGAYQCGPKLKHIQYINPDIYLFVTISIC